MRVQSREGQTTQYVCKRVILRLFTTSNPKLFLVGDFPQMSAPPETMGAYEQDAQTFKNVLNAC